MKGTSLEEHYATYWVQWRESERRFYKLLAPSAEETLKKELNSRLQVAYTLKEEGNRLFRNQEYNNAIQKYIDTIEAVPRELFQGFFKFEYNKLKLAVITNLSICFVKSKNYEAAVLQCKEGLKIFPNNVKLLYILGGALGDAQEYEQALEILKIAKSLEPSNRDVVERMKSISESKKEYNSKMREMFGGKLQPPVKKEEIKEEEEPKDGPAEQAVKTNSNLGYYLLGAVSVLGLAALFYKRLR